MDRRATVTGGALAAEPLTDGELDDLTAGAVSNPIDADFLTSQGSHVLVKGEAIVAPTVQDMQMLLSDNAQQNLNSLITINAVNSEINVLLNLNISIDSNVGDVIQTNWNDLLANP